MERAYSSTTAARGESKRSTEEQHDADTPPSFVGVAVADGKVVTMDNTAAGTQDQVLHGQDQNKIVQHLYHELHRYIRELNWKDFEHYLLTEVKKKSPHVILKLLTKQDSSSDIQQCYSRYTHSWWDRHPPDGRTLLHLLCRFRAPISLLEHVIDMYWTAKHQVNKNRNNRYRHVNKRTKEKKQENNDNDNKEQNQAEETNNLFTIQTRKGQETPLHYVIRYYDQTFRSSGGGDGDRGAAVSRDGDCLKRIQTLLGDKYFQNQKNSDNAVKPFSFQSNDDAESSSKTKVEGPFASSKIVMAMLESLLKEDADGNTPLFNVVQASNSFTIIEYLIEMDFMFSGGKSLLQKGNKHMELVTKIQENAHGSRSSSVFSFWETIRRRNDGTTIMRDGSSTRPDSSTTSSSVLMSETPLEFVFRRGLVRTTSGTRMRADLHYLLLATNAAMVDTINVYQNMQRLLLQRQQQQLQELQQQQHTNQEERRSTRSTTTSRNEYQNDLNNAIYLTPAEKVSCYTRNIRITEEANTVEGGNNQNDDEEQGFLEACIRCSSIFTSRKHALSMVKHGMSVETKKKQEEGSTTTPITIHGQSPLHCSLNLGVNNNHDLVVPSNVVRYLLKEYPNAVPIPDPITERLPLLEALCRRCCTNNTTSTSSATVTATMGVNQTTNNSKRDEDEDDSLIMDLFLAHPVGADELLKIDQQQCNKLYPFMLAGMQSLRTSTFLLFRACSVKDGLLSTSNIDTGSSQ